MANTENEQPLIFRFSWFIKSLPAFGRIDGEPPLPYPSSPGKKASGKCSIR